MKTTHTSRRLDRPVRIVFLGPCDAVGGAVPRIVRELSSGLTERGWLVSTKFWGARSPSEGLAQKALSRARDALRVAAEVSADGADVVVIHSGMDWKTIPRDLLLCARLRRHVSAIILQPHGGHAEWVGDDRPTVFRMLSRDLLRLVDGVFVLSWEEAVLYARGEPKVAVRRVTNPFDAIESPRPAERDVRRSTNLLFVGRVVETKGVLDAIEAMSLAPGQITLTIVGDGPLLPRARALALTLGLGERVRFVGRVEGRALQALYAMSDVLVLPTYWAEGFPTVLAEAMAAGLGIITTPVRGTRDYLADEVNCLFVPPRRPEQIAAAIERLHEHEQLLRQMGESNRQAVQRFSSNRVFAEYEESLLQIWRVARARRRDGRGLE